MPSSIPKAGTASFRPHSKRATGPSARALGKEARNLHAGARAPVARGARGSGGRGGGAGMKHLLRARAPGDVSRTCVVRGGRVPALRGAGRESGPGRLGVWEGRFPGRWRRPLAAAAQRGRHAVRRSPRAACGGALPPSAGSSAAWVATAPAAGVGEDGCECGCSWFAAAATAAAEEEENQATGEEGGRRGGGGGGVRGRRRRGG